MKCKICENVMDRSSPFETCYPCEFEELKDGGFSFVIKDLKSQLSASQIREKESELLIEAMRKGIDAVTGVMSDSEGVSGLHLNGDIATWSELTTGGQFEEHLMPLDKAIVAYDDYQSAMRSCKEEK